jgi:regulator of protease activity HflC (stomatin/prohibitin superfamily)
LKSETFKLGRVMLTKEKQNIWVKKFIQWLITRQSWVYMKITDISF